MKGEERGEGEKNVVAASALQAATSAMLHLIEERVMKKGKKEKERKRKGALNDVRNPSRGSPRANRCKREGKKGEKGKE